MADKWGPLQIPLAPGLEDDAVGDPALSTLLSFLQAFLVKDGNTGALWNQFGVAPGQPCVKTVRVWNPSDAHGDHRGLAFTTNDLPALYAWRDEGKEEWIAEDYLRETTQVKLLWVFPLAVQATQKNRQPFVNALKKCITLAIERGRTPGWVVPADPDPRAASEGSSLYTFMNDSSLYVTKWRPSRVVVEGDVGKMSYPAAEITIELLEDVDWDLERFDEATSIRIKQTNAQGDVTDDQLLESPDPSGNEGD